MEKEKNISSISLPIAIILAGLIIAGGIFLGLNKPSSVVDNSEINSNKNIEIVFRNIDNTDYVLGNPDADIALIEYSDLECPACKFFHTSLNSAVNKFGKTGQLSWIYRNFPLEQLHSKAPKQAEAILCAGKLGGSEKYWALINKIFETTPSNNGLDMSKLGQYAEDVGLNKTNFESCLNSGEMTDRVNSEKEEAVVAGGRGTPFSILVLKTPLSNKQITNFENYIKSKRLIGRDGTPYVEVANKGKVVILTAGFSPSDLIEIIDNVLK